MGKIERAIYEPHDGTTKLNTLGALFNMCVLLEEEDVCTFQATWEEAMDDAITVGNLIPEDIKIGLILNKLPESWETFTTMNNNIKSLPKYLQRFFMKAFGDKRKRQINQWPWLLQSADINNINQQIDKDIKLEKGKPLSQIDQVTRMMGKVVVRT